MGFLNVVKKMLDVAFVVIVKILLNMLQAFLKNNIPAIKSKIKCSDTYVIYSIQCKVCPKQYVGQTTTSCAKRFYSHSSDILNKKNDKPVAIHFNSRNHSKSDMIFTPFEKLYVKIKLC